MNAMQQLHGLGQSLWLDNITHGLLTSGTLGRYIEELAVTGLTSNPTIFDHAIKDGEFYDDAIRRRSLAGKSDEALFFELATEDLVQAADLFRPPHDAIGGVDGWVSLEVSPLLADDTAGSIKAAAELHARAERPNLFIKIPATRAGIPAIEESTFAGVPVDFRIEATWGEQIEDRRSQITFSALGQQAPIEEKEKWDPDFAKRKKRQARLEQLIPGFSVRLGGTTSVDVTKLGIDKGYGMRKLRDTLGIGLHEMLFIGDALFPGGNDYPVKEAGVESIQVRDPNETKRVIEAIVACLGRARHATLREDDMR